MGHTKKLKKEKKEFPGSLKCQVRPTPAIEVTIVIPAVGNTVPSRFITDCSGQSGEIEVGTTSAGVIFRVAELSAD